MTPEDKLDSTADTINVQETADLLAEWSTRCSQLEDQYKRSLADYQNLLRRSQQDKEQLSLFAAERTVLAILPAIDNFHYALRSLAASEERKALETVLDGLLRSLETVGVSLLSPLVGTSFDPTSQEAIATVPSPEEAGKVLEVYSPGYSLNGRVLKPVRLCVSAGPDQSQQA